MGDGILQRVLTAALAGLSAVAGQASAATISLLNPNQTVTLPTSGAETIYFDGTATKVFTPSIFVTEAFQFGNASLYPTLFADFTQWAITGSSPYTGHLFSFTINAASITGLYTYSSSNGPARIDLTLSIIPSFRFA